MSTRKLKNVELTAFFQRGAYHKLMIETTEGSGMST